MPPEKTWPLAGGPWVNDTGADSSALFGNERPCVAGEYQYAEVTLSYTRTSQSGVAAKNSIR